MEEWIRDLSMQARAERKRHYQEIFTGDLEKELGTGTRLHRQYTNVAKMVQVADGARQAFWTLLRRSLKAVT